MAYEMTEIKKSQQIFYYLLRHRQLSEADDQELYQDYVGDEQVINLVKAQGEAAGSTIVRYGGAIYMIPDEDNDYLGFSKAQLKSALCRSGATDKDYYLSQFVILTLLVEFYDGSGHSSKTRDFMRVGELMNCLTQRLGAGSSNEEEQEKGGLAFTNMLEAFAALRSEEKGSHAKTTKEGFLYTILNFMQKQGLIEYIEADEMIMTTDKLDRFMDWNLLNRNNFDRVLKVLGERADE